MKNARFLAVALMTTAFSSLLFTGCKKDDNNDGPSGNGSMTAVVDGKTWNAVSSKIAGSIISGTLNLTGIAGDGSTITITLSVANPDTGTFYDLGEGSLGALAMTVTGGSSAWTSNVPSGDGTLVLTQLDTAAKKFSGTFVATVYRGTDDSTRVIAAGVFKNVKYSTTIQGGGSNTMSCKIDGNTWTPPSVLAVSSGGQITISGTDASAGKTVGITIPSTIAAGTYTLELFTTYSAQYNVNSTTFLGATGGPSCSLVITAHNATNHTISGTFEFVAEPITGPPPTATITDGVFSVTYQ